MSHGYISRPVPILEPPTTLDRTTITVNLHDPRAAEELVEVRDFGVSGDNFYARKDGSNPPYGQPIEGAISDLLLRRSVAERLVKAEEALRQIGLRLYVLDGYRPISTQNGLWRFYWEKFARKEPSLTDRDLTAKTATFVSDPRAFQRDNPQTCPLHSTGGAVDLTLSSSSGMLLDLGSDFDEMEDKAATAHFEQSLMRGKIADDDPRLLNRRTLYWAMRDAGFTNYLNEWWHYDWGNQMHVLTMGLLGEPIASGAAWYGYIEPRGVE